MVPLNLKESLRETSNAVPFSATSYSHSEGMQLP